MGKRRLGAVLLAAGCATMARADGPVLHEYVPHPEEDEATSVISDGGGGASAIVYDGEVLPAPEDGALRSDERAMSAPPGTRTGSGEAGPHYRPDRMTELEETLGYYTVFTPSIAPFKRVTALDRVALDQDGTPVLRVGQSDAQPVPVEESNAGPPDPRPRDRFWGSVVADFSTGERVRFPSVSPESRILSMRTVPSGAPVRIERDAADNFYAVATGELPEEQIRIVFLTDAPQSYFNTSVPEVSSDLLADEVHSLPARLQRQAERFASELGLSRGDPLPKVLRKLAAHFRAFEESAEPPQNTGQIYLDLARSKRGVCRHRAYAFVITAQALGIPSRFVYNEAHSWVEVKMPDGVGWMRIDLGGAAEGLEAHGTDDRPIYEPTEPDPLPQPEAYRRAYAQMGAQMQSAGEPGGATRDPAGSADGSRGMASGAAASAGGASGGAAAFDGSAAASSDDAAQARRPVVLSVERRRYEVFRGRALEVSGRATGTSGDGVEGLRVEVLLRGQQELLLGVTVSREHGWFRGSFGVPPDLDVGDYRLVVRTPGDEEHAPAMAR